MGNEEANGKSDTVSRQSRDFKRTSLHVLALVEEDKVSTEQCTISKSPRCTNWPYLREEGRASYSLE